MKCAHGHDGSRCSQCVQAANPSLAVRRVAQSGPSLLVDGVPQRPIDLGTPQLSTRRQRAAVGQPNRKPKRSR